jgi:hypothetical protein
MRSSFCKLSVEGTADFWVATVVRTVVNAFSENFKSSAIIVTFFGGAVSQTVRDGDGGFNTVMLREGLYNRIINMDNN